MAIHNISALSLLLILIAAEASTALKDGEAGSETSPDNDDFKDWLTWEPREEVRQLYPITRIGHDIDGSAVYVKEIGLWNPGKLEAEPKEKREEFWKYFEKLVRLQERDAMLSSDGRGNVVILDFDGFHFNHNVTVKDREIVFKQFTFVGREIKATKKGFMINVDGEFNNFGRLTGAGPYLEQYLKKFEKFNGPHANEWRGKLLEQIPADQLPVKYGGSKSSTSWYD